MTDDWIPIYDGTDLPGFFVAIGTSGNQFKNAPVIGLLMLALIKNGWTAVTTTHPVQWVAPHTGSTLNLEHYSRRRTAIRAAATPYSAERPRSAPQSDDLQGARAARRVASPGAGSSLSRDLCQGGRLAQSGPPQPAN